MSTPGRGIFTAPTPTIFAPKDGKPGSSQALVGLISRFSAGPRACLGQDFAMMEISYTIVRFAKGSWGYKATGRGEGGSGMDGEAETYARAAECGWM